jgi:hypothetical protein
MKKILARSIIIVIFSLVYLAGGAPPWAAYMGAVITSYLALPVRAT